MTELTIRFTHQHAEAVHLRDQGFEPIECAFGQHGSVLGPLNLDHHGTESHREGVALRACRDLYGARVSDPRFVVTGTPDADAVLAIIALAAMVPAERIPRPFYEVVNRNDIDPIGCDLFAAPFGEELAWFNQRQGLMQSEAGFRQAIENMRQLLMGGLSASERAVVRRADEHRRERARLGILECLAVDGGRLSSAPPGEGDPVLRGALALSGPARVLVVQSDVWGFDVWYRVAPVVVSFASRMAKTTVGCPDEDTAARLFGEGGLGAVWPRLGQGWGGRSSVGGSPRGVRHGVSETKETARKIVDCLIG